MVGIHSTVDKQAKRMPDITVETTNLELGECLVSGSLQSYWDMCLV